MLILEIEGDKRTPYVRLTNSSLYLSGRTYPEHALTFYKPIMDVINEVNSYNEFLVELNLEYINTSSSKTLLYILQKISEKTKSEVVVTWSIDKDDDAMFEMSEYFSSMINNMKIRII